jgi:hypothetical protein
MRTADPATPDEFEDVLEAALDGATLTCRGLSQEVNDRLEDVAALSPGGERDAAVAAARAAFAAQRPE